MNKLSECEKGYRRWIAYTKPNMKTKTKSAAILTIHDAANMSTTGRKSVVAWLRRQAGFLQNNSAQLSKRFTARYIYEDKRHA